MWKTKSPVPEIREKWYKHESLSDLANKLNDLTIKGTELEPRKQKRNPEHQDEKPSSTLTEEDGIKQLHIK